MTMVVRRCNKPVLTPSHSRQLFIGEVADKVGALNSIELCFARHLAYTASMAMSPVATSHFGRLANLMRTGLTNVLAIAINQFGWICNEDLVPKVGDGVLIIITSIIFDMIQCHFDDLM